MFNPNGEKLPMNSCVVVDLQKDEEIATISINNNYFSATPIEKGGRFSGKTILGSGQTDEILYTSTPYLAKKFDAAVLTSENDKIKAKRTTTIYGNLAEECKKLIGLSAGSALTSQVLINDGTYRYATISSNKDMLIYLYLATFCCSKKILSPKRIGTIAMKKEDQKKRLKIVH